MRFVIDVWICRRLLFLTVEQGKWYNLSRLFLHSRPLIRVIIQSVRYDWAQPESVPVSRRERIIECKLAVFQRGRQRDCPFFVGNLADLPGGLGENTGRTKTQRE